MIDVATSTAHSPAWTSSATPEAETVLPYAPTRLGLARRIAAYRAVTHAVARAAKPRAGPAKSAAVHAPFYVRVTVVRNGRRAPLKPDAVQPRVAQQTMRIRSTTIVAVRRDGKLAIAGDGQVTLDKTIVKHSARKVRKIAGGKVLAGFAGSAADGITLLEKFERKYSEYKDVTARRRRACQRLAPGPGACAGSRRC